ncbi:MAG: M48 family metallopeptidase [Nitriliruptor sp.]
MPPASPPVEHRPATPTLPALEIHRSPRRRRSASAAARDQVVVVRLPLGISRAEEERLIAGLVHKVTGASRAASRRSDADLERRAARLADRYLDGIRASSVSWSSRMRRRYGSCTPAEGTIRISRELASAPDYVLDHVLLHELVHLRVPGHGADFHELLDRHPDARRASGWLEGYAAGRLAAGTEPDAAGDDLVDDDVVDDGVLS